MVRRVRAGAVLLAAVALAAAACGKSETTVSSPTPTPNFTTLDSGTLTVGSDIPYPPFEFNDSTGKLVGFDVELMEAIAAKIGVTVKWVDTNFDTIFTSLAAHKFDAVASSVTAYAPAGSPAAEDVAKRSQIVAFSAPYYSSLQSLTVDATKTPGITSTKRLKSGDRVGVQSGTTGKSWAEQNLKPKGVEIVSFTKAPQMFDALQAGRIKGVVNDLPVSLDAIKGKPDLKVVEQIDTGEQYAFAVDRTNPELLAAINRALTDLLGDGTYAGIFTKYFPDQRLPSYAKR